MSLSLEWKAEGVIDGESKDRDCDEVIPWYAQDEDWRLNQDSEQNEWAQRHTRICESKFRMNSYIVQ